MLAYLLTACRRSEVFNLRRRDLDLQGGFHRYTSKGDRERQRALPTPMREALLAQAEVAGLARDRRKPSSGPLVDQPVDGKYFGEQLQRAQTPPSGP